jgi:hypothetical protein
MNPCCEDLANREVQPIAPEQRELARRSSGATPTLQTCAVCKRRHFLLTVDPARFGVMGQSMGGR